MKGILLLAVIHLFVIYQSQKQKKPEPGQLETIEQAQLTARHALTYQGFEPNERLDEYRFLPISLRNMVVFAGYRKPSF